MSSLRCRAPISEGIADAKKRQSAETPKQAPLPNERMVKNLGATEGAPLLPLAVGWPSNDQEHSCLALLNTVSWLLSTQHEDHEIKAQLSRS
jgi:hypothetical protein